MYTHTGAIYGIEIYACMYVYVFFAISILCVRVCIQVLFTALTVECRLAAACFWTPGQHPMGAWQAFSVGFLKKKPND